MLFLGSKRDIIIVTGCNAVGKTTATNHLRELATKYNIPLENIIIADSQCLFEAMQEDDLEGGFHHTHENRQPGTRGHSHDTNLPLFPFTVVDNELPNKMRKQFFKKLTKLPYSGKFWFVEWAGGVNKNQDSSIDYSYALVKCMLEDGELPTKWLKRVKAILHVTAEDQVRFILNKKRSVPFFPRPEAIENGTAFWQKDEKVLRFYGKDDFAEIKDLLEAHGIGIHTIENNGDACFYHKLAEIADEIFVTDKTLVTKSLSGLANITKHSIIFMQISHIFSLLKRPNERKQQITRPLTDTEPAKEKASV